MAPTHEEGYPVIRMYGCILTTSTSRRTEPDSTIDTRGQEESDRTYPTSQEMAQETGWQTRPAGSALGVECGCIAPNEGVPTSQRPCGGGKVRSRWYLCPVHTQKLRLVGADVPTGDPVRHSDNVPASETWAGEVSSLSECRCEYSQPNMTAAESGYACQFGALDPLQRDTNGEGNCSSCSRVERTFQGCVHRLGTQGAIHEKAHRTFQPTIHDEFLAEGPFWHTTRCTY